MSMPTPPKPFGYLEGLLPNDSTVVYGWAGDGKIPSAKVTLDVFVNNKALSTIICDGERKDLVDDKGRFGYAFNFRLPRLPETDNGYLLSLRFPGTEEELTGSPMPINATTPEPTPTTVHAKEFLQKLPITTLHCMGFLDGFDPADSTIIYGWCLDLDRPGRKVLLEILMDGKPEETILCDCYRADLTDEQGRPRGYGFYYQIPRRYFDGQLHEIDILVANTTISLQNAPQRKVLPGNPACIPQHRTDPVIAICAILKNELPYLLEWIAFHKVIGVDDFVLYDNMSTDGGTAVLQALQAAGELVCYLWSDDAGPNRQIMAYNHYVEGFRSRHDWTLFLDLDEFLVPVKHDSLKPLTAVSQDVTALAINWMIFGSAGADSSDGRPVTERFTSRAPEDMQLNRTFKSLCRTALIDKAGIHASLMWRGESRNLAGQSIGSFGYNWLSLQPIHEEFRIHHYFVKSRQEWEMKKIRGRPDADIGSRFSRRTQEEFELYDRNDIVDESALRFLDATRMEMARLRNLPGIAEALAAAGYST